jgi:hypothetical protein
MAVAEIEPPPLFFFGGGAPRTKDPKVLFWTLKEFVPNDRVNFLSGTETFVNYNHLKSIVSSRKTTFTILTPIKSFYVAAQPERPYIEPSFTKQEFEEEIPRFLLITAVGASGKTALAIKLSADTSMPILDLRSHPPVADNTLTGLLTTSFPLEQLSDILTSLKNGTYGVIIDGIDEGRSKVNEPAFNAFLDDLIKRSAGSPPN